MDQETIRLLITATASVTAGVIGALIGFASAQRVARRTIEGQRQLALDKDVRDARREATQTILRLADDLSNHFSTAVSALNSRDFHELERTSDYFQTATVTSWSFMAITDDALDQAMRRWTDTVAGFLELMPATVETARKMSSEEIDEHVKKLKQQNDEVVMAATIELRRAAEAYWSRLT